MTERQTMGLIAEAKARVEAARRDRDKAASIVRSLDPMSPDQRHTLRIVLAEKQGRLDAEVRGLLMEVGVLLREEVDG